MLKKQGKIHAQKRTGAVSHSDFDGLPRLVDHRPRIGLLRRCGSQSSVCRFNEDEHSGF